MGQWTVWGHKESGLSNAEHMVAENVGSKLRPVRLMSVSHQRQLDVWE